MRRKDREMGENFALTIIDKSTYGTVSMVDKGDVPYAVPLSIVRDGKALYFHSATAGRKIDTLQDNANVCVIFVGEVEVPELFSEEELQEIKRDEKQIGKLASSVFTTQFESAMVRGKALLVEDDEEKLKALRLLCLKYTPSKMEYFELAANSSLSRTNIYKIEIEIISAKRKKYDAHGQEMKWGREM